MIEISYSQFDSPFNCVYIIALSIVSKLIIQEIVIDTTTLSKTTKILIAIALTLIVARFVVVGMPKVLFNQISSDGDESAYLSLGLDLREQGILSDGTRPPLYAAMMVPFAEREWSYFTTAKLMTLGIGVATLLALFWAGVKMFGWQTALLATFLLAANREFHIRSATVYADVLLALVMVGAWYFLIKSVEHWKYGILAGFFVGLSFLTKGSAPVLLAAWGLMAFLHFGWAVFRRFELAIVPLVFIITSLPLLIYNANTFGSPTYNFATQHIMWMDRLAQINTADPDDLPTFQTYIATHDWNDVEERIDRGLRRLNPVVSRSVIPSRTIEPMWLAWSLGGLAIAIAGYLLLFQRDAVWRYLRERQNAIAFTVILCGLFYVFFTWYVAGSSAETRFIVPLLGPIYLIFADIVVNLVRGLSKRLNVPQTWRLATENRPALIVQVGLLLVVGWSVWWLFETSRVESWGLTVNPYESDRLANQEEETIVQWLSADSPMEETFVSFGPSKSLPLWKFPPHFTIERLPVDVDTWPEMQTYIAEAQPDYVIIDDDTARRRREALSGFFQRENERVQFDAPPPGWTLVHAAPGLPCRWCIFSPTEQATPLAELTGGLQLLDYDVVHAQATYAEEELVLYTPQDRRLRVSLTWQATEPLPADYTLFVHLTAADGFVKAQRDQPPFGGALPTSQWQPKAVLADRFDLELDQSVTPGEYLLLAGMYDPATGERLPLLEGRAGPAPHTVLLGTVRIEAAEARR